MKRPTDGRPPRAIPLGACARANCAGTRGRRGMTYLDVLVLAAVLPIASVFLVSCMTCGSRETANRVKCASNLRQIGQALLLYSNENAKAYPRTTYVPGAKPVWGTGAPATRPFDSNGPQPNDVTAALFLLLRTQEITSEIFVCPSANEERDNYGGGSNSPLNRSNFTDVKKNLSYSFTNPYPDTPAANKGYKLTNERSAEFAVAADKNPGVRGKESNVLTVKPSNNGNQMKLGNSGCHDRDGQNVLYGEGHVEFQNNPFVGVKGDNIYTSQSGQVSASPVGPEDSVLLPADE